ncbi:MAG: dihydrodipicolinate synthase family protein [Kiritimatiellae bacterium]|nr:dihydrodipicolinate synthase family protein [Kiritimatiellia bacterium]
MKGKNGTLTLPQSGCFKDMGGPYAAMMTPFTKDYRINEGAIEQLMEYGIAGGLRGFYLTGSSGEGMLLSVAERKQVFRRAARVAKGRCKLIAHVGAVRTDDSIELAREAAKVGCDWVSSVAPVYFGQTFEAQYRHYRDISEATDLPFMVYCFRASLVPDRDVRLFDLKNVKGMKYTGGDYYAVQCLKRRLNKEAIFFAGRDEQFACAMALGNVFSGAIGTSENFLPRHFANIYECCMRNDFAQAAKWQDEVNRFVEVMIADENWSCWKALAKHIGIDCGPARRPYEPLSQAEERKWVKRFADLGIVPKNAALR